MKTNLHAVLVAQTAKAAASTNPNHRAPREFNLDRPHAVGQFLRAHPDALRVVKRLQHEAEDIGTLGAQLRSKGYGAAA